VQGNFENALDFDLSQFNTYVDSIRFMMSSMFESILYRMFRQGRADIDLYRKALSLHAFKKDSSNLFGYIFKQFLIQGSSQGSIIFS